MADDEQRDAEVDLEINDADRDRDRESAEQAKALDKMTDLVPEKQLDENRVKKAMVSLAASQRADKEAKLKREKELAAVKVNKDDIDIVALEFEVDKKVAEKKLRECNGVLLDTLRAFL